MHSFKKKDFDELLREAARRGFKCAKKGNKLFLYHPDKARGVRTCHVDQKGFFELKRFVENREN